LAFTTNPGCEILVATKGPQAMSGVPDDANFDLWDWEWDW
jgi:hypothetical protein